MSCAGIRLQSRKKAPSGAPMAFSGLAPGASASVPNLSLSRACAATVQTGASTLAHALSGEFRVGRESDSDPLALLIEGARTNFVTKSRSVHTMAAGGAGSSADFAAGPDGSVLADRQNIATDGQSNQETLSGTLNGDFFVASEFVASTSGTAQHAQLVYYDGGAAISHASDAGVTSWRRLHTPAKTQALGGATVICSDSRNHVPNGGVNPPAADLLIDFVQCEKGKYPTSPIVTSGAAVSRLPDALTIVDAKRFISGGKLRLTLVFRPLCTLAELVYDTALPCPLFVASDGSAQAWVNPSTRLLTLYAGGKSSCFVLPTWARSSRVELAIQAGGGAAPIARIRIDGGAVSELARSGFDGSSTASVASADLLSFSGAHPFPCWLESISPGIKLPAGSAAATPSVTTRVICEGNSITYGYLTTTPYPNRLQTGLGGGYSVTNLAVSGSVIEAAADDGGNPSMRSRRLQAGGYADFGSVAILWEFTNTLAMLAVAGYSASDAATAALARWKRLVRDYRSIGFKVLAFTMLPRTDVYISAPQSAVVEAARLICNAAILSDSECGDYAWDLTQNTNLSSVNPTYYNADQVHLTDAGNQEVADEAVDAFLTHSL